MEEKIDTVVEEKEVNEWADHVMSNLTSLLQGYINNAKDAGVRIKYSSPITAQYETHTDYDTTKADGVQLVIDIEFDGLIDMPK